jgi:DNA-binding MurR/RpiR family transcriptional regulator
MTKDISALIESKMPTLSKGQRRISSVIMQSYEKAAYMTAAKLGELAGVSESTVVRFATELGFEGYPEFQHAVQELVRSRLTPNQRIEMTNLRIGDGDLLSNVMRSDMEKIKITLEKIDRESFDGAVNALINAKQIYIFGVRSSSYLASFLHFNLGMIFENVKLIEATGTSEVFEQALNISAGDVMLAISFPRYSSRAVSAVKYARDRGADVIALTDSKSSPIAPYANQLLTAESDMASYVDSLVAPLSIINAMLVKITRLKQEEVKERFDRLERIWEEYEVYAKQ